MFRGLHQGTQERGKAFPSDVLDWTSTVARSLIGSADANHSQTGLEFARDLRLTGLASTLDAAAGSDAVHPQHRLTALEALAAVDVQQAVLRFAELLQSDSPMEMKKPAAERLGKLKSPAGTEALMKVLSVAPADYAVYLARGLAWSDHGGDALLRLIEEGKAAPHLLNDGVVSSEIGARVFERKDERLAQIRQSIPSHDESLSKLVAERRAGFATAETDIERGRTLFQKTCANCHQMSGQGAKIGPQLDGVGIRGFDRLLEDTLEPDRNVDQAFRRTNILRVDGSIVTGMVLRQEGAVLILADSAGKEIRIPDSEIEERQESMLSPMPSDVASMLPPADFYDLMAYLLTERSEPQKTN